MTYQYVPAKTHHLAHFAISCLTFGLWLPVWFLAWLHNHNRMVPKLLPTAPPTYHPGVSAGYPDQPSYYTSLPFEQPHGDQYRPHPPER